MKTLVRPLLLVIAAQMSYGQFKGTVISTFWECGPKPLHECPTSVLVEDANTQMNTSSMKRLHLYIGAGKDIPLIEYAEVTFDIVDEAGKQVQITPVKANEKSYFRIREQQCGVYYLHLEPGQKLGSVKIIWKGSEQTFPMSEAKKVETTIET